MPDLSWLGEFDQYAVIGSGMQEPDCSRQPRPGDLVE